MCTPKESNLFFRLFIASLNKVSSIWSTYYDRLNGVVVDNLTLCGISFDPFKNMKFVQFKKEIKANNSFCFFFF